MAEAMGLEKPVIATGYSGNLHFMTVDNSYLVDYVTQAVPDGCFRILRGCPGPIPISIMPRNACEGYLSVPTKPSGERGRRGRTSSRNTACIPRPQS